MKEELNETKGKIGKWISLKHFQIMGWSWKCQVVGTKSGFSNETKKRHLTLILLYDTWILSVWWQPTHSCCCAKYIIKVHYSDLAIQINEKKNQYKSMNAIAINVFVISSCLRVFFTSADFQSLHSDIERWLWWTPHRHTFWFLTSSWLFPF